MSETTEKKPYAFRKLSSVDVFLMAKIISKIGINEFTACFENDSIKEAIAKVTNAERGTKEADTGASIVGVSVILELSNVILTNIPKCENEIYQLLSQTSDLKIEKIKKLDAAVFIEMVIDFIKKEEFKDFLKVVSKLFK